MKSCVALMLLLASTPAAAAPKKPVTVVFAESIEGVKPGMTRAEVKKAGHRLTPEGVDRLVRVGFFSGPLLILFDATTDKVVLISVELRRTGGLRVGRQLLPPTITPQEFAKRLPNCVVSVGSGGNAVACTDDHGRVLNAYDSAFRGPVQWVHLGPG